MDYYSQAKDIASELVQNRRALHRIPEIGMEEHRTAAYIRQKLDEMEIFWVEASPTGTVAVIGLDGPVIGLRADIDGLSIQEKNDCPYASENTGKMHACGHDAHTAALLGAARLLKARESKLPGRVKLIFQPAEETGKGAQAVIDSGAISDCAGIFALHVASDLPTGICCISKGVVGAGNDRFMIRIHGKTCHGSTPQKGIDALAVGTALAQNMQTMMTRSTDPLQPVSMNIGIFRAGSAFNVLPGEAYLEGSIRILDESLREQNRSNLRRLANGICMAYGATAEVEYENTASILINDSALTDVAVDAVSSFLGRDAIHEQRPSLGAEDFANFLRVTRGTYLHVGSGNPAKGTDRPHHNEKFNVDEDVLPICAAAYAGFAEKYFSRYSKGVSCS